MMMGGYLSTEVNLPLTDRERIVLELVADGMSNRQIAEHLVLSPTTVKWYIKQIFNKLGANRRTQAVKIASELHLVNDQSVEHDSKPSIPTPVTELVGREREMEEIIDLLRSSTVRLVTILGPGGIGKTRLAIEIAQGQVKQSPGQVCFVSLDSVSSLSGLIQAVAASIRFQFHGQLETGQQLLYGLRNRNLLLVMDSLEHLSEAGRFISKMLLAAPGLKILATSRERLNLSGETIYPLQGLDYPKTTSQNKDYAAFILFMNIARFSQPAFEPGSDYVLSIGNICQLVEGMPLAIELAARWIDLLTPEQIAEEISQGLSILQTNIQDIPERHRNIRAVFDRSWQLLSVNEREVFKKLSVFRGGFDRAAAEYVADANLFVLSTLVDKSLLMRVGVDRFKPHELVRQFALEKLRKNFDEYQDALQRHYQYYASLMEHYESEIKTDVSTLSASVLRTFNDFDNILLGWDQAMASASIPEVVNYGFNLNLCFTARGLTSIGINKFKQVLDLFDAHSDMVKPADRVRVTTFLGWSLLNQANYEQALNVLENAAEIIPFVDESHLTDVGLLQAFWGWSLYLNEKVEDSRSRAQKGLKTCRAANFDFGILMCLSILGEIEHAEGSPAKAYDYLYEALILSERAQDAFVIAFTFAHLGHVCCMLRKVDDAVDYLQRGLTFNRHTLNVIAILLTILGIAGVYEVRGQPDAALELFAILLYHPQYGGATSSIVEPAKRILLSQLQSRLPENQIDDIMEKAKHSQLSSCYLDPQFTVSPEIVDQLLELLDRAATA